MEDKNFYLLDCTLRDGGYVNNWEFETEIVLNIMNKLYQSKIDIIELGILGKSNEIGKSTKFNRFDEMTIFMENRQPGCLYAVMLNFSEKDLFVIPKRTDATVEIIRLAFFKQEYKAALEYGEELMKKGYCVFLQAMATPLYSEEELLALVEEVNEKKPFSFYIVDSFGTLFNDDIDRLFCLVNEHLSKEIVFGFHAHNNLQMAFSNSIEFFKLGRNRRIAIDSTVFGMGRGAGNVGTEQMMEYLNKKYNETYDTSIILEVYSKYLKQIYDREYWGYDAKYYLTAQKNMNSAYAWYLSSKGITSISDMKNILDLIPEETRHNLNKQITDHAITKHREWVSSLE